MNKKQKIQYIKTRLEEEEGNIESIEEELIELLNKRMKENNLELFLAEVIVKNLLEDVLTSGKK